MPTPSEPLYLVSLETQSLSTAKNSEDIKFCSKCRRYLTLDKFSPNRGYKGWNSIWCKLCISDYGKQWRKERKQIALIHKQEGKFFGLTKPCRTCKKTKSFDEFTLLPASPDYHCYECMDCVAEKSKEYRKENIESIRSRGKSEETKANNKKWRDRNPEYLRLKNKEWHESHPDYSKISSRKNWILRYGITEKWYIETLFEQGEVCAICRSHESGLAGKRFHIDHDHSCCSESCTACDKCRRGILCNYCNLRLGYLEDKEWVNLARKYLEKYPLSTEISDLSLTKGNEKYHIRYAHRGIKDGWYDDILLLQGGCGICGSQQANGRNDRFHIDHCHECCGKNRSCNRCRRGLLCSPCNLKLGRVEDYSWVEKAIAYLNKYSKKPAIDPDQGSLFDF